MAMILCPTCRKNDTIEYYSSTGEVYCRRCEGGCVPPLIVDDPNAIADEDPKPEEPPHQRPTWDEYFISFAQLTAKRSPDQRLRVGCVLVTSGQHPNRVIATGYNGYLSGCRHESRMRDGHEMATIHAEQNAIADAARRGTATSDGIAYVTHYPCIHCAKLLAAAGIREIVYAEEYREDPLVETLLEEAGVTVRKFQ